MSETHPVPLTLSTADQRALKIAASSWIKTSELLPTEEDADGEGYVLAVVTGAGCGRTIKWQFVHRPNAFDLWMPIPKVPKE